MVQFVADYNVGMTRAILLLLLILPTVANAQTAFVDNNVRIDTNLNDLPYGGSRTIYLDKNGSIEANLPADVGYIYIERGDKAVIEFSRPSLLYYPIYGSGYGRLHHHRHWRW